MTGWKGGTFHPPAVSEYVQNELFMGGSATYQDVKTKTGTGQGWNFHPSTPKPVTRRFTANTCPACGAITIAGLVLGIRVDLEPHTLTDLDEYQAVRDGVRTWDYRHDATITDRGVAEIRGPTRHDRHARHVCGTTYGTQPRTRTVTRTPTDHTEPPF